jgi:hypothetical protein
MGGLQGRVIGGYRLADQLTSGGIAEVYRAQPTAPGGREAVVKIIYPEFVGQPGFRARFDQIVQMARRLNHPHILPLLGSGDQNGYLYLVTPYVAAGTLRDWLRNGRHLGAHDVAPFFRQVCEAMSYAHSLSILHGNLKPSNIFVHEGRHVLIGDFGRLWDPSQIDMSHAGPGTEAVEYLAPEAIEGRPDQRSDLYSLGAILFASLVGRAPFGGTTPFEIFSKHRQQPVPHLGDIAPPLPATVVSLDEVVQRAMAKAPTSRYASVLALAQAIETAIRGAARLAPVAAPATRGAGGNGLGAGGPLQQGASAGLPASMAGALGPMNGSVPLAMGSASLLSGLVDPSMEDGRMAVSEPGANGSHILPLSPNPLSAATPSPPGAPDWNGIAAPIGHPGAPGSANEFDFPALPTARVPAPPSAALAPSIAGSAFYGDVAMQATTRVPAEAGRSSDPSPGVPPGGFVVKGGAAEWPPRAQDRANGMAALSPPGAMPPLGALPEIASLPPRDPRDSRPFSATQLGLPRLTSPDLGEIPPSWRELVSGAAGMPDQAYGPPAGEEVPDRFADVPSWRSSGPPGDDGQLSGDDRNRWGNSDGWGAESGQWADPQVDSREFGGVGDYSESMQGVTGSDLVPDLFASSSLSVLEPIPGGGARRGPGSSGSRFDPDADDDHHPGDPFADPSAWARATEAGYRKGHTRRGRAVHYRQPRMRRAPPRARSLFMLLLLFVLVDSALLVVLRPDLCPGNRCAPVHRLIVHYVPALNFTYAQPPAFTVSPQQVSMQVAVGATQKSVLVLTNTTSMTTAWAESNDLKWVGATPTSGALAASRTVTVTITASPPAGTKPGAYATTATFTVGATTVKVPITITVSAAK